MSSERDGDAATRWHLRTVLADLAALYLAKGWWTDETLGAVVADGLAAKATAGFNVHSRERPWRGTIGDVDRAARSFAGWLRANGIGPGDVVVFQLPNWVEAAITFWGAAYAGAVVVPIVHFYGSKEVSYILRATDPAVVISTVGFGHMDYLEWYQQLMAEQDAQWLVVGDAPLHGLPAQAMAFEDVLAADPVAGPTPTNPDAPAVVAFTSGTTRDPKGVVHSHRTVVFESTQLAELVPSLGGPPLTGAPVGHFIGMLNALLVSLRKPDGVNLIDVWDPAEVLRLMREEHLALTGGATYFLTSLLDHAEFLPEDLAAMPYMGLGGSAVPVAVTERATRLGITVYRSYGSTEHPSITGSMLDEPEVKRLTTDGHALSGVEIRLDDDGQILSRGPDLFLGYTDPELTALVFDDDGWYHTGDVGALDDDGYPTITDRISDIIIRGGENISAQEIEELMLGLDAVAEVSVVAAPDERLGEHAAAIVRVREHMKPPTIDEVRAHLASAGVARQKWPESIYQVDDFPRTPSGKVQKFRLRQQVHAGELG